jgi:hypothetical protein
MENVERKKPKKGEEHLLPKGEGGGMEGMSAR